MFRPIRTGAMVAAASAVALAASLAGSQVPPVTPRAPAVSPSDSCADLRAEVTALRAQVSRLQQELLAQRAPAHTAPAAAPNHKGAPASVASSARSFPPLCTPPTYVDAAGIRRVLPECMDYLMVDRGPSADRDAPSSSDQLLLDRGPSYRGSTPSKDAGDLMDYRGPSTSSGSPTTDSNPCAHPVSVDAQGIRHFKRECF